MQRLVNFFTARINPALQDLAVLGTIFGITFFQFLGRYPLLEPDEGRYSEIPREMLERGDFITPLLNYVKYFEKPPLLYWLNSLSFSIFGQNEFAARFPCALAGLLTVLFTYWLGRKLFDRRTGLYAAVIIGSCLGFAPQARINLTDMPLTFCLTLALGSFILAVRSEGRAKALYYYLSYAAAALAVLAKGLVGILFPGAIIFLFLLLRKRWNILKEMRLLTGISLFLLLTAPWFVLVSVKNPEFARFFFIHEHFERFLTKVHGRFKPFWYFLPILAGVMFPWILFVPSALRDAWKKRREEYGEPLTYLAIWAIFIFLFFSKSNSKLIPYILPVVPPLALMTAAAFREKIETGRRLQVLLTAALCTMLVQVVAGHLVYRNLSEKKTVKQLALKVKELAAPGDLVASFGYDQTLPFYAARRTVVVGGMGELEFGSRQGDQSDWFIDPDRFRNLWESERKVFLVLSNNELESYLKNWGKAPSIIIQGRRHLLVTNQSH
jgi:4-amino-4-deoxy-L-arabinose transferase-like glycosyltransferase